MLKLFYKILFILSSNNLEDSLAFRGLRKIFKLLINMLYPIYYRAYRNTESGVNRNSTNNVIITLTSFPARINHVWVCIESLLRQKSKPNRIILWLADSQFNGIESLPRNLLNLRDRGLEIKFCEDLRSHKKYYYTMLNNPNSNVIIVDDDMYYPDDLVTNLLSTAEKFPNTICCNRGHFMQFNNSVILPYDKWLRKRDDNSPSLDLCPTGCGGVFYPAHSLDYEVFNKEAIKNLCLNADDLWLKVMSLRNGISTIKTNANAIGFFDIIQTQSVKLTNSNVGDNMNDVQLKNIIDEYQLDLYNLVNK